VDVKGTYRYVTRLSELGIPVEMHIYPVGGHGLGLANGLYGRATEPYVQRWIEDLERWLRLIGFINP
jgi:dipeptidyl aminopeptidase/acylaminoacyl peptidase